MKRLFLYLLIAGSLIACSTSKTSTPEELAKIQETIDKIETGDYSIVVNMAVPLRGKSIPLTSLYDLTIRNDSAIAYLPFFGRATYAPYGGGEGGIKFALPVENYQSKVNKKNNGYDVQFKINTPEYNYQFYLTLFNNGQSTIAVNSPQRDAITFYGYIKE